MVRHLRTPSWTSPENRSQADCRVIPSAEPIRAQLTFRPRSKFTRSCSAEKRPIFKPAQPGPVRAPATVPKSGRPNPDHPDAPPIGTGHYPGAKESQRNLSGTRTLLRTVGTGDGQRLPSR